jgi:hypothetical protein
MHLEGSCHCGSVRFSLEAPHPYPFMQCYCSICRKTQGGGGYGINLGGLADSLEVQGSEHLQVYQAKMGVESDGRPIISAMERSFCKHCGSHLFAWDPRWPDLIHPHASAIDSPLPQPPERCHIMLGSKASWVILKDDPQDKTYEDYPEESLEAWHKRLGLEG